MPVLPFRPDSYNGVIIDPTVAATATAGPGEEKVEVGLFPADVEAFAQALDASLAAWRAAGRRGVWLKVPDEECMYWDVEKSVCASLKCGESVNASPTRPFAHTTAAPVPGLPCARCGGAGLHLPPRGTISHTYRERWSPSVYVRALRVWHLLPYRTDAAPLSFLMQEPDYVMMTRWLDESTPSTLPPGPTHQVGILVGGWWRWLNDY